MQSGKTNVIKTKTVSKRKHIKPAFQVRRNFTFLF
jgi:hypothetical protein